MATLKRTEKMRDRIYSCVGVGDCKMELKGKYSDPISEALLSPFTSRIGI